MIIPISIIIPGNKEVGPITLVDRINAMAYSTYNNINSHVAGDILNFKNVTGVPKKLFNCLGKKMQIESIEYEYGNAGGGMTDSYYGKTHKILNVKMLIS
jgi:hypothetical protein